MDGAAFLVCVVVVVVVVVIVVLSRPGEVRWSRNRLVGFAVGALIVGVVVLVLHFTGPTGSHGSPGEGFLDIKWAEDVWLGVGLISTGCGVGYFLYDMLARKK